MRTQLQKAETFRALHRRGRAFVIPNPWDVGTARLLAHLGFEALASTSAGQAFSLGVEDNDVSREQTMRHVAELASATALPLNVDLGNGFGDAPEAAAEAIRLAAQAGAVGGSIEDATGRAEDPIYPFAEAVARIQAAAAAARSLPFPFTLTARAENFLWGRPDLPDTLARLQAYAEAGADVLYAPGLTSREQIAAVVQAVPRPVNILVGSPALSVTVGELTDLGVRRISLGSVLSRAALGAFLEAAREIRDNGSFTFGARAVPYGEINALFAALSP